MTDLRADVRASLSAPPEKGRDGGMTAVFCFSPTFRGFQGHFPDNPVLPGIVQILMAELTAGGAGCFALTEISRCKFLRPIRPEEAVTVTATPSDKAGKWSCDLRVGDEWCARMVLCLEACVC